MTDKQPFSFLIRPNERAALKRLAQMTERSEGATLRWLIREKARELGAQNEMTRNAARQTGVNYATA